MKTDTIQIEFKERMTGHFSAKKFELAPLEPLVRSEFKSGEGRSDNLPFEFELNITVPDLQNFLNDQSTPSRVGGQITDFRFRKKVSIEQGFLQLFTRPAASTDFDTAKEMHYTLFVTDQEGKKWTFFGFKEILKEDAVNMWQQTTTLYYYLWEGHSTYETYGTKSVHGVGILHISLVDFISMLRSFKTNAVSVIGEQDALRKYFSSFVANLWDAYAPYVFTTTSSRWNEHPYPVHTTQGVTFGDKSLYPLDTRDGLSVSVQRFKVADTKSVVLLLHGLTTSTDMFIMPEHQNIVNHLHANGFSDVWSLDWRGSSRFKYNTEPHLFTIDDVARFDIPAAIAHIREQCGDDVKIHVIAHCVGSLAFSAALAAGYVKNIASFTANSVSLTPQVKWQAALKMMVGPEILEHIFGYTYMSPRVPYFPGAGFGKWIYWMERTLRSECKEPACHLVSFMWGWGFPAAFNHRNIHPVTHRRLLDLFGGSSFHYYKHIRKMLLHKASLSWNGKINYLEKMMMIDMPPTLFLSGKDNHIFPNSNKKTYEILRETKNRNNVRYLEIENYGHQDIFMGQYCHKEVFPLLVNFLKEHDGVVKATKLRIA